MRSTLPLTEKFLPVWVPAGMAISTFSVNRWTVSPRAAWTKEILCIVIVDPSRVNLSLGLTLMITKSPYEFHLWPARRDLLDLFHLLNLWQILYGFVFHVLFHDKFLIGFLTCSRQISKATWRRIIPVVACVSTLITPWPWQRQVTGLVPGFTIPNMSYMSH